MALVAHVYGQTQSAAWVSAAVLGRFVPYTLLAPLAGVVADRHERRNVMAVADGLQLAAMIALTLVAALSGPAVVVGLVLSLTAVGTAVGTLLAPALAAAIGLPATLVLAGLLPVTIAAAALGLLNGFDTDVDRGRRALAPRVALLERLRLLEGAGPAVLQRLAATADEERVPAGTVVLRQGDPADDLLVLVDGELVVDHQDGAVQRRVNQMAAPDHLGEIGLVEHGDGHHVHRRGALASARRGLPRRGERRPGASTDADHRHPQPPRPHTDEADVRPCRPSDSHRVAHRTAHRLRRRDPSPSEQFTPKEDTMTEQHHIAQHHIPQDDIPQDDIPPNDIPQDDEVIGHVLREGHAEADETDDVTGHLSGALGSKKKAEDQA